MTLSAPKGVSFHSLWARLKNVLHVLDSSLNVHAVMHIHIFPFLTIVVASANNLNTPQSGQLVQSHCLKNFFLALFVYNIIESLT